MKLPTFTVDTSRIQSGFHGQGCQGAQSDLTPFNEYDQLSQPERNRISFLTVPITPGGRRPSTADMVIEKLKVERMEGGGLSVSGVALAANCHLSLIIFGAFFLLAGLVLSYLGFAGQSQEGVVAQAAGAPEGAFEKSDTYKQMQIIGPVFLIVGILMLVLGFTMYAIGRKIRHDDKDKRASITALQLRQLEKSFDQARDRSNGSPIHTFSSTTNESQPILSVRRGSWWMEPAPVESPPDVNSLSDQPPPYTQSSPRTSIQENSTRIDSAHQKSQQQNYSPPLVTVQLSYPLHSTVLSTLPDTFGVASFPIKFDQRLDLAGRRLSASNSSPCPSPTNVFEVQECPDSQDDSKEIIIERPQSSKEIENTKKVIESENEDKSGLQIPQIQVTPSSLETMATVVTTASSNTASNLPLSKNGVALPRLSRHSISSRGDPPA